MVNKPVKQVIIVGGGTAGWLCAGLLAAKLGKDQLPSSNAIKVTLLESPQVPSIGVGEGSWPSLRTSLEDIGITESEFIACCHASFKQGSTFEGWRNGQPNDRYIHPFTTPVGYTEINTHGCWQQLFNSQSFAESFCLQPSMCEAGKAPKQASTPDYAYVLNYGYHFDATALAKLLTKHCTSRLGVIHKQAHVAEVKASENGDISGVITDTGEILHADLFIDCSGNNALLIEKHFGVEWHSVAPILLNNSAVAVQAPYCDNDTSIASTTIATAKDCGWIWDIGLPHRRGVGMVYSSDFSSQQNAETLLREHLKKRLSDAQIDALECRHLQFSPGYRKQFWVNNCLSLGMSAGFIEPLEASAIAMVELGIRMLYEQFPYNREHMDLVAKRYNERFTYRWQRVIDFVKLHYVLSQRETPYWQAQRNPTSIPDSLAELLEIWKYQAPSRFDLIQNEEIFPSASYQYILYGMGYNTHHRTLLPNCEMVRKAQAIKQNLDKGTAQLLAGLPTNRELLNNIVSRYRNKEQKELHHDVIGFR